MKVISTNIAKPTIITRNGKKTKTGIYKKPVKKPIYLGKTGVLGDTVVDKRYHGGIDKACYIYSSNHYNYWKNIFPHLEWNWGMFGENLTIEGIDETKIKIGDTFSLGDAIIQVSEPRRPCSTLGIRFGNQQIVKLFNNSEYPGTYVRILKEGNIKVGDSLNLTSSNPDNLSVCQVFKLLSSKEKNLNQATIALSMESLAETTKNDIRMKFKL